MCEGHGKIYKEKLGGRELCVQHCAARRKNLIAKNPKGAVHLCSKKKLKIILG